MVRRQVHLCLPDFDATRFMPSLVDVLIPGCPLVWLDDTTGKADETVATLQRIFRLSKRPGSKASLFMVSSQEEFEGKCIEGGSGEQEGDGKKQRTFIFSADYRPPTSVRTPARHKVSLSQDELTDHAFGPPAKGFDYHDRVSAPYYAKPFYEAVSNCSSSASSTAPMLSTPSLSGSSSSSSSSPNFPLSPASTTMSVTIASSRSAKRVSTEVIDSEAESYFPPQPAPESKELPTAFPPSTTATTMVPPPPSSISLKPQSSGLMCRTADDPGSGASMPQRLDQALEYTGQERVTTANYEQRRLALPGPSTPLESQPLRPWSPSDSFDEQRRHRSHSLRHCASSPQVVQNVVRKQKQKQRSTQAMNTVTAVTLESDTPISSSIRSQHSSLGRPSSTSSTKDSLEPKVMSTTTVARTPATSLSTAMKRYVPPPKGTFRTSYARTLRSEMASLSDISLLQTIAELPAEATSNHPEVTLSLRPTPPPGNLSRGIVRRLRRNGRELIRVDEQEPSDHNIVLSVSEFDLFGARQVLSTTEWSASKPWMRSPAAPPPPKTRRWLRRVRQGQPPEGEEWPTAEITEIADDLFEPPSVPRSRRESGRSVHAVEPVRIENLTRSGMAQNNDRFVEMQKNATNVLPATGPGSTGYHSSSEKEDECIPV